MEKELSKGTKFLNYFILILILFSLFIIGFSLFSTSSNSNNTADVVQNSNTESPF